MYELVAIEIAASGMGSQRIRMSVVASNLANANSTRRPDGPGPYLRRMVVQKADVLPTFEYMLAEARSRTEADALFATPAESSTLLEEHIRGVRVSDIVTDPATRRVYDPNHPDRDADGYVTYPDISVIQEMTDMISASRVYEANLAVMKSTKDMLVQTLELLKA